MHNQVPANNAILPEAPKKAVEEMIAIITELQDVYTLETSALETSQIDTFLSLQSQKLYVARRYENGIKQMISRQSEMKSVDAGLRNRLRNLQRDFSQLAFKNRNALVRMQKTTNRLGETIRSAAKDVVEKRVATSYSAQGSLNKYKKGNMSVGVSETA